MEITAEGIYYPEGEIPNKQYASKLAAVLSNSSKSSYVALSQEEQLAARTVINMIQSGSLKVDKTKTFRDYINEQLATIQDHHITSLVKATGVDGKIIREILQTFGGQGVNEEELKCWGRLSKILDTVDYQVFKTWLIQEKSLDPQRLDLTLDLTWAANRIITKFFEQGGMNVADWDSSNFN